MTATVSVPRPPVHRASWVRDLVLGVRLAVGGGRTSWARLALGTIGVGLAVAVLLAAASFGTVNAARTARGLAAMPGPQSSGPPSPLQLLPRSFPYGVGSVAGNYVHATGPDSPIPPGLTRIPGPGEIVLSPALAAVFNSEAGKGLRARFPQRVVGTIGDAGLRGPNVLEFYAGTTNIPGTGANATDVEQVYRFGSPPTAQSLDSSLLALVIIGVVALLLPILIFVSVSSRIAGAERDRRLAALRLVGAGSWQVRRIAAAESLVSAGTGLVFGALAFLGLRAIAPHVDVLGWSTFSSDVTPSWPLVVLIVLFVPVLTVGTVLLAMRRTIIEPLGVVRGAKPVRRRLWWRLGLVVVGVALLLLAKRGGDGGSTGWVVTVVTGACALLVGVPVLLPWLLERGIAKIRGGAPSWQLAIRRLQLDSGTPARVVGGVAVVLAGAIALQLVLFAAANRVNLPAAQPRNSGWVAIPSTTAAAPKVAALLAHVPAAKEVDVTESSDGPVAGHTGDYANYHEVVVAPCAVITRHFHGSRCVDGDTFVVQNGSNTLKPGTVLELTAAHDYNPAVKSPPVPFTVPSAALPLPADHSETYGPYSGDGVVLTPGAAARVRLPADRRTETYVRTDPSQVDAADQLAVALAPLTWQVSVQPLSSGSSLSTTQKEFVSIRNILLGGSLFTLLLAGVSMLVLGLEQVRERRRPLAVLAAAGVPRAALGRSLLWQTAVPVVLGVVVALGTGIGLAALVIRLTSMRLTLDWATIGIFTGAAVMLVLLVTALTMPPLRGAMRLSALRTE